MKEETDIKELKEKKEIKGEGWMVEKVAEGFGIIDGNGNMYDHEEEYFKEMTKLVKKKVVKKNN